MKRVCMVAALMVLVGLLQRVPQASASCTAQRACANGSSISCSGGSSCLSGINWIECDGNRITCPTSSCGRQIICPPPYPAYRLGCYTPNGTCSSTSTSVRCGGTTYTCAQCQSGAINCQLLQEP
jgi:hypothetical protein